MEKTSQGVDSQADIIILCNLSGRLAQLVRASRLHREGRGFESLSAHQNKSESPFVKNGFFAILQAMKNDPQFDFWYAVNNTEVISVPERRLETFGATMVNYHLVTELMDSVDKVRVREGKLKAFRPEIITPQSIEQMMLEGFGSEARDYADWLHKHAQEMQILKYGFKVQKQEINDYILTDPLQTVVDRVKDQVAERNDPLGAVLVGVDRPWEVCLLKLMVELVQH